MNGKIEICGVDVIVYDDYRDKGAKFLLLQPVEKGDDYEGFIEGQIEHIKSLASGVPFVMAAIETGDSNSALSPWKSPSVFGKGGDFGDGAAQTLSLIEKIIPEIEKAAGAGESSCRILGGYSLAGLFALWTGYRSDRFHGVAAASPSVWFPDWDKFIENEGMRATRVYLSLGDKEHRAKNPVFASVQRRIELQHRSLVSQLGETSCTLEMNEGNHFKDPDLRLAKGFAWIMNGFEKNFKNLPKNQLD